MKQITLSVTGFVLADGDAIKRDLRHADYTSVVTPATREHELREGRSLSMARHGAAAHAKLRIEACAANPHLHGAVY